MTVIYEWDVETVETYEDGDNDIHEHYHCETYGDAQRWAMRQPAIPGFTYEVVLVRDDDDRRSWAYVIDGKMPEYAEDADGRKWGKIPQRYIREVEALK